VVVEVDPPPPEPLEDFPVDPLLPGPVPVVELLLHACAETPRPKATAAPTIQANFTDFIRYAFQ
jgi:hypothetical protein